jgi:hypothetical protein
MASNKNKDNREFEQTPDLLDIIGIVFIFIMVANYGPLAVMPYGALWLIQYKLRRTNWFYQLTTRHNKLKIALPEQPIPDKVDEKTFYTGITKPLFATDTLDTIPAKITIEHIPDPQTPLAVPIGFGISKVSGKAKWVWADFNSQTVHALIAGQTGSGKDNLLRLWFMTLTKYNKPYEVKFVIIDGKGEWLLPDIMNGEHLFIPPAGGINIQRDEKGKWVDRANDDIEQAIESVMSELDRRNKLFQAARVTSVERYREVTGLPLPYLIIIATDVGQNVQSSSNLNMLLNVLTSKGRSLGVRMIVSMQTTSKQDTFWRSNLSLIVCGALQNDSQDSPVIGLPVDNIFYRPSKFPSPQQRAGLFFVRAGDNQYVVQSPYISYDTFDHYTRELPQKHVDPFLKGLLL